METTRPINVSTLITSSHYLLLIQACLLIIAAFFLQAVTCPAVDVSHIMLEAYKKFILVSLALHGKVISCNIQLIKDFYGLLQDSLSVNVRGCLLFNATKVLSQSVVFILDKTCFVRFDVWRY